MFTEPQPHQPHQSKPTEGGQGGQLAPFLTKLYDLTHDHTANKITWDEEGTHFTIQDPQYFAMHVLPKCFDHAKLKSFVRQLNTYGFSKVGGPPDYSGPVTFTHTEGYFVRNTPGRLGKIKRRVKPRKRRRREPETTTTTTTTTPGTDDDPQRRMFELDAEVTTLKRKREQDEATLETMRGEHQEMEQRLAHVQETAQTLRTDLECARTENAAIMGSIQTLLTTLITHPVTTTCSPYQPRQSVARQLQQETHDLIFGRPSPDDDLWEQCKDQDRPLKRHRPLPLPTPFPTLTYPSTTFT